MTINQVKWGETLGKEANAALQQYGLWSFQTGYTKLERFLNKNQQTQRKLLKFENWTNEEPQWLAKIKGFKVDYFDFSCIKLEKLVLIR